jgi:hypothetical protein
MPHISCAGCGAGPFTDPDALLDHNQRCDYTDGAGQPIDVTVKFSVTCWHITTVRSDVLAQTTGGLPFTALAGEVDGGFPDNDTEIAVTDFLTDQIAEGIETVMDGYEIGAVYPSSRDDISRLERKTP